MASATGLYTLHDTGIPVGSHNYTTLVILHGYAWHGAIFKRLLPLASSQNARIILVNRRDYPGARPYSAEERALLSVHSAKSQLSSEETESISTTLSLFMQHRAREVYDFLVELVKASNVPPVDPASDNGGIVLVGWSYGAVWMTALLTHAASFSTTESTVDVGKYIKRVILFDAVACLLGYYLGPPHDTFNPFCEPSYTFETNTDEIMDWIGGYYVHGNTLDTLARSTPLHVPPPTPRTFSPEDMREVTYAAPGCTGDSDRMLLDGAARIELFGSLWKSALHPGVHRLGPRLAGEDSWSRIGIRIVWADQSVWEVPYMIWCVKAELDEGRALVRKMREVTFARIRGGNHFAQWDHPEKTLHAFLASDGEVDSSLEMPSVTERCEP